MPTAWFVTHPEVAIDPAVPVPDWGLSAEGQRRAALLARQPWVPGLAAVFSSAERKASAEQLAQLNVQHALELSEAQKASAAALANADERIERAVAARMRMLDDQMAAEAAVHEASPDAPRACARHGDDAGSALANCCTVSAPSPGHSIIECTGSELISAIRDSSAPV